MGSVVSSRLGFLMSLGSFRDLLRASWAGLALVSGWVFIFKAHLLEPMVVRRSYLGTDRHIVAFRVGERVQHCAQTGEWF